MGRTRKTIVAISAGLVGVLVMAGVAAATRGRDGGSNGAPQVRLEDRSTTSSGVVTTSSGVVTTLAPGTSTTAEPGDDNGNDTSTSNPGNNTSTSFPGDDDTSTTVGTSTTLAPINAGERSFTVSGGTVVIDIRVDRSLALVSVTPNPGVEVDRAEVSADEVRVEFEGPDGDSRVRVRIDDGRLRIETGDN